MEENPESSRPLGYDWTLMLALAAPVAYLFAYRFSACYLQHFGIPDTLVDVNVKDLLYMGGILLSICYGGYIFLDGFLVFLPDTWPKALRRRALLLLLSGSAAVYLLLMERAGWLAWLIVSCIFLPFVFFLVVRPLNRKSVALPDTPPPPDPYAHKGVIPVLMRAGIKRELLLTGLLVLTRPPAATQLPPPRAT